MRSKQLYIGHFVTLIIGSLIYIVFRSESLRMFRWFKELRVLNSIISIRSNLNITSSQLPNFVVFALPDGLWMFSYVSLILYIWKNKVQLESFLWIFILPLVAIGSEIGQLIKIVPGTFDNTDLIMYVLGAVLPFLVFKKSII